MNHSTTGGYWSCFEKLPRSVQALARQNFSLMKVDPRHPSLHLKTVGRFWSVRVGLRYRALAVRRSDQLVWFWIGSHAEYDQLIGRR